MGDGGVACVPLARFPVPEKLCGGDRALTFLPRKNMREPERTAGSAASDKVLKREGRLRDTELERGEVDRRHRCESDKREHRRSNGELEKGEVVSNRWRRDGLEKGEVVSDRWRRDALEKGEVVSDRWRRDGLEKGEVISDRRRRDGLEKGEDANKRGVNDGVATQSTSQNLVVGKGDRHRKGDKEFPPDDHRDKHGSGHREEWDRRKRSSSKWSGDSRDRDDRTGSQKHGSSNGKSYDKEQSNSESFLKRQCTASAAGRKYRDEPHERSGSDRRRTVEENTCKQHEHPEKFNSHDKISEHSGQKAKRISEESSAKQLEHREKSHRSLTSEISKLFSPSSSQNSHRHREASLPPRGSSVRHARSPKPPLERSPPKGRSHHYEHRNNSPACSERLERSLHERGRHHESREKTPGFLERLQHRRSSSRDDNDHALPHTEQCSVECSRQSEAKERSPFPLEHLPHTSGRASSPSDEASRPVITESKASNLDERNTYRKSSERNSSEHDSCKQSGHGVSLQEKVAEDRPIKEKLLPSPKLYVCDPPPPPPLPPSPLPPPPPPTANGVSEETPSMEEDMDICDTPPHAGASLDSDMGKWFYLDHFGIERGPSKLMHLKKLVDDGTLPSDHLIKHSDCDRWVTVENAVSPLICANPQSVVSDAVTQMVSPPEASGNALLDSEDSSYDMLDSLQLEKHSETFDDQLFDARVGALLDGFHIVPGKELETLGEALGTTFIKAEWENWGRLEGFTRSQLYSPDLQRHPRVDESSTFLDHVPKENTETRPARTFERDLFFPANDSTDLFTGKCPCKGGDWKRNDDVSQDRYQRRKIVLNEGFPICQMPKCGYEDPRWHRKDDLYHASCSKKLNLPSWAYSGFDDNNDSSGDVNKSTPTNKTSQIKQFPTRGLKGTMLSVVRINTCVIKDHGSSASDCRVRTKHTERHGSRSSHHNGGNEKSSCLDGTAKSKKHLDYDFHSPQNDRTSVETPKNRLCNRDELSLHSGDWYYLDGAGHEHGPYLFSEMLNLVSKGSVIEHSSIFRKVDNIWVPVTTGVLSSSTSASQEQTGKLTPASVGTPVRSERSDGNIDNVNTVSSFHSLCPQYIGYMCGKLHELVMKSYRSREFATAINGVLDPWWNSKQSEESDKHFLFSNSIAQTSVHGYDLAGGNFWRPEEDVAGVFNRPKKRARLTADGSDEDHEMNGDLLNDQELYSYDDLCDKPAPSEVIDANQSGESWGLLSIHILGRIFHFLKDDLKSTAFAAASCRQWKAAIQFYRGISKVVDFSSLGSNCNDSNVRSIMSGYDCNTITTLVFARCTRLSPGLLGEILQLFPAIKVVDIRGCNQFGELMPVFKNVKWIKSHYLDMSKRLEESNIKARNLRQATERSISSGKFYKGSEEKGGFFVNDLNNSRKDSARLTFRHGYYRRTKLLDARKTTGALTRDAQLKQLIRKKSENAYRKLEPIIVESLKNIVSENTYKFLIPKVAEIEEKMRNGYYVRHGMISIKDDIRRICRNMIKVKRQFRSEDTNRIIIPILQLIKHLENPLQSYENYGGLRAFKDDKEATWSADLKVRKKHNVNDKRHNNRAINAGNGTADHRFRKFNRVIKRSLSKLNRRYQDTESETSGDLTDEDGLSDGETTGSETESDLDLRVEVGNLNVKDSYSILDDTLDATDDRGWGARMTKASLVPPITRKYEVIESYLVVADEEEVQRKMRVALPDDYAEKLLAQNSGTDEADMEIPEVKDFKPRKVLGEEVLEQEVYGIDPYTHNLLLHSMPEDIECPLIEKHRFIEEELLSTLNKQVRHFTGSGSAPMVYHLQPVIEEIKKNAEEIGNVHTMKTCYALLKAIRSRPDDNYVAYRKGLGVVCNKEKGFSEDDFVVEFLGEVYPSWKWYEKQDGIRSLQENSEDPLPEFYNINLERPKGDRDGYDLVVVDAMHKANYASRICHSCKPNCEAKVTAVDGHYQIGIYTVRPIAYGEEITFDYNSVTESKEEYEASVCLCGSRVCRGSYLNLTGEEAFQNILNESHGLLDRHKLMLDACEANSVSEEDYIELGKAGLGPCLLSGLPDWLVAYSARLVRFINFERKLLPEEILKHNIEEKKKYIPNYNIEDEKDDAEIQAEGVYNQRLQNMAITIDKVKYVMRCVFGDPMKAPPPLERLSSEAVVLLIWKGENSLVNELLKCLAAYMDVHSLKNLKSRIHENDPPASGDVMAELQKSLKWLRDAVREIPCSDKCRNDAAADLIHMYAHTKYYFRVREYKSFKSPPVCISHLDMGPKYVEKMGSGFQEYCKTYGENYCLGQLIYWNYQTNPDPDCTLMEARRGCLCLPDITSFYSESEESRRLVYGPRTINRMRLRMQKKPQEQWALDKIWVFQDSPAFLASPMLDAVIEDCPLDNDMLNWLKSRTPVFQGKNDW